MDSRKIQVSSFIAFSLILSSFFKSRRIFIWLLFVVRKRRSNLLDSCLLIKEGFTSFCIHFFFFDDSAFVGIGCCIWSEIHQILLFLQIFYLLQVSFSRSISLSILQFYDKCYILVFVIQVLVKDDQWCVVLWIDLLVSFRPPLIFPAEISGNWAFQRKSWIWAGCFRLPLCWFAWNFCWCR